MATIVVLEHEFQREQMSQWSMIRAYAERWRQHGHVVLWHYGPGDPPAGDLAILHVNPSVVPQEYLRLLSFYPRVLNSAVLDISKTTFSQHILTPDDPWTGPVIVKTNANYRGLPEAKLRATATQAGTAANVRASPLIRKYLIYDTLADVPKEMWQTRGLIVERFLPERDERGRYCVRIWTFLGDRQRCVIWRSYYPLVKADNVVRSEPVDPPETLHRWREHLGFDFGKFDYVVYDGQEILLDVNRTPTYPDPNDPVVREAVAQLAPGIRYYLQG
jgi:hypothetical protein